MKQRKLLTCTRVRGCLVGLDSSYTLRILSEYFICEAATSLLEPMCGRLRRRNQITAKQI
jgi:hypothetical protein